MPEEDGAGIEVSRSFTKKHSYALVARGTTGVDKSFVVVKEPRSRCNRCRKSLATLMSSLGMEITFLVITCLYGVLVLFDFLAPESVTTDLSKME